MNMEALQQLAHQMGLQEYDNSSSRKVLIRAIQKQRGQEQCFLTDKRYTCDEVCEWRENCQKLRAVWLR